MAAVMKRLPNQAKALARFQIDQVLLNAEFPETEQTSYVTVHAERDHKSAKQFPNFLQISH